MMGEQLVKIAESKVNKHFCFSSGWAKKEKRKVVIQFWINHNYHS